MARELIFHHVAFAYEGSPTDILNDFTAHFPTGWSGIVGENGAGKSTILRLAAGLLTASRGRVAHPGLAVYCAQRTDNPPDALAELLAGTSAQAAVLRRRLQVEQDWRRRWTSLSHGERKRAQLAVALWQEPALLALDEPTNHLDEQTAALVADTLRSYAGVGLLVSHDRALLDGLCERCLFVTPGAAALRPGSYSQAAQQERRERETASRRRREADGELKRLRREQQARRAKADRARARRSGRHASRKDSDARAKRRLAVISGQDGKAGRLLSQLERRVERAQRRAASTSVEKAAPTSLWMPGVCSRRATVASLPAGRLSLGSERTLVHPSLALAPRDRVAVSGPNGAGKSTLVRALLADPQVAPERLVLLPQELSADDAAALLAEIGNLDDDALGRLLAVYRGLGSRPERLLASALPSPGEARKLLLALGVARVPHLIVMDEPTNHLDLPAVEALEEALAGCPCALLLVSHDRRFLEHLCDTEWRLTPAERRQVRLRTLDLPPRSERAPASQRRP